MSPRTLPLDPVTLRKLRDLQFRQLTDRHAQGPVYATWEADEVGAVKRLAFALFGDRATCSFTRAGQAFISRAERPLTFVERQPANAWMLRRVRFEDVLTGFTYSDLLAQARLMPEAAGRIPGRIVTRRARG